MSFRLTLRFRIIALVTLFAILLIAAFSALLVTHQLREITENNLFRARVGSFASKGALERALLTSLRSGDPVEGFQRMIPILQEGQLAEKIAVADLKGRVVSASEPEWKTLGLQHEELEWLQYARNTYTSSNWYHARVEPTEATLYVPITLDDTPQYIAIFRYSLGNMTEAIQEVRGLCLWVAGGVIAVVVPLCLLLIQSILDPIRSLNRATQEIAAGNLNRQVEIETEDELGTLAETFNQMTQSLVGMKARAENANPLTKLPGNNVIHEEIEKRIRSKQKFFAVYADLDNFKAFNDKYGIGVGDKAIKLTAQIMKDVLLHQGSSGDFLGHEGGDDFFILTTPERLDAVAGTLCSQFDQRIRELYSAEDKTQGFIVSKDREGNVKQFPIMTISLAGVSNVNRELVSYAEVTNICAEIKKKAKSASRENGKSMLVMDKRAGNSRGTVDRSTATSPPPATPNPGPTVQT